MFQPNLPWLLGSKISKFSKGVEWLEEFHWVEVRRGLWYQVGRGGTNGPRKSMTIQRGNAYMGIHKWFFLVEYGLFGGFKPFEKYAQVKLDHFPKFYRWTWKKIFELPPPSGICIPTSRTPTRTILASLGVSHLRSLTVSPLNKWWQRGDGNLSFCALA